MIRRLLAEIRADRKGLAERDAELDRFLGAWSGSDEGQAAALAHVLDRGYSGLEALLERSVRALDGDAPRAIDWHRGLLEAASLDIPSVRPAILDGTKAAADDLRRFRHFVRHADAAPLDAARALSLATAWRDARLRLRADLDAFESFLEQLASSTSARARSRAARVSVRGRRRAAR
jgi:hypothetical protein